MSTKETYFISTQEASNPDILTERLNYILQRIADRLDQIEGGRGAPTIAEKLVISKDDDTDQVHGINSI